MGHIASSRADAVLCEAALACQIPPTHVVTWWVTENGIRRKTANYICAGHATVLSKAVRSGNAARYDHTPVVIIRFCLAAEQDAREAGRSPWPMG